MLRRGVALATKESIEIWKESHPYALWDDGQNVQMLLIKHTNQKESAQRLATVTIYAFEKHVYRPVPLHALYLSYLLHSYHLDLPESCS